MNNFNNTNCQISLLGLEDLKKLNKSNKKNLQIKREIYRDFENKMSSSKSTTSVPWQISIAFYIYLILSLINML